MNFLFLKTLCPLKKALQLFFILALSSFSACDIDLPDPDDSPECLALKTTQAAIFVGLNSEDPEVRKEAEEALQSLRQQMNAEGCR